MVVKTQDDLKNPKAKLVSTKESKTTTIPLTDGF
jgi:hypothetical protein